jgi:hypothetical protein
MVHRSTDCTKSSIASIGSVISSRSTFSSSITQLITSLLMPNATGTNLCAEPHVRPSIAIALIDAANALRSVLI